MFVESYYYYRIIIIRQRKCVCVGERVRERIGLEREKRSQKFSTRDKRLSAERSGKDAVSEEKKNRDRELAYLWSGTKQFFSFSCVFTFNYRANITASRCSYCGLRFFFPPNSSTSRSVSAFIKVKCMCTRLSHETKWSKQNEKNGNKTMFVISMINYILYIYMYI